MRRQFMCVWCAKSNKSFDLHSRCLFYQTVINFCNVKANFSGTKTILSAITIHKVAGWSPVVWEVEFISNHESTTIRKYIHLFRWATRRYDLCDISHIRVGVVVADGLVPIWYQDICDRHKTLSRSTDGRSAATWWICCYQMNAIISW